MLWFRAQCPVMVRFLDISVLWEGEKILLALRRKKIYEVLLCRKNYKNTNTYVLYGYNSKTLYIAVATTKLR